MSSAVKGPEDQKDGKDVKRDLSKIRKCFPRGRQARLPCRPLYGANRERPAVKRAFVVVCQTLCVLAIDIFDELVRLFGLTVRRRH
jgi:hypothetical protein